MDKICKDQGSLGGKAVSTEQVSCSGGAPCAGHPFLSTPLGRAPLLQGEEPGLLDLGVGITGGSVDCRDTPDQRQGQGGGEVTLRKLSSPGGAGGVEDVSSRAGHPRGGRGRGGSRTRTDHHRKPR